MYKRILRVYKNKRANSYVTCHLIRQGIVFFEKLVVCPAGRPEFPYYSIHTINLRYFIIVSTKGRHWAPPWDVLAVVTPVRYA